MTTDGIFALDGGEWEVTNNIWLVGDDRRSSSSTRPTTPARSSRPSTAAGCAAIALTHGHNDHINAAVALQDAVDAPILLHPADHDVVERRVPRPRARTATWPMGRRCSPVAPTLGVLHTPGHSPGGCCFVLADGGHVFSGDTLFCGGPGATGRSHSDFPTIIESIRSRLLTLPPETIVHTGHGDTTTVGAEAPDLEEWLRRGH